MAARRHLWILAVILAATSPAPGQPVQGAGANTGGRIFTPVDETEMPAEPPEVDADVSNPVPPSQPPDAAGDVESDSVAAVEDRRILARGPGEGGRTDLENNRIDQDGKPAGSGQIWQTLGALAVVVGLIFAAKWLLSRYGGGRVRRGGGVIEVLTKTAVSARHSVMLIRVGSRLLVVGAGGDGMNTLTEINDPEQVSELLGAVKRAEAESLSNSFARALRGQRVDLQDDGAVEPTGRTPAGGAADQIKGLLGRVRRMGSGREEQL